MIKLISLEQAEIASVIGQTLRLSSNGVVENLNFRCLVRKAAISVATFYLKKKLHGEQYQ